MSTPTRFTICFMLITSGLVWSLTAETHAQEQPSILPVEYHEGFIDNVMFWSDRMIIPEGEVPWHQTVIDELRIEEDEEFYRAGFLKRGDQWIPIFFLRRFEMMHNVYQHYLVIKGEPGRIHLSSGINVEDFGTIISNEGYDFFMPTVASVSRDEKEMDELEALDIATMQLESYGFQYIYWFDIEEERRGTVAEEWQVNVDED